MGISKTARKCWKLVSDASTAWGLFPEAIAKWLFGSAWLGGGVMASFFADIPVLYIMTALTVLFAFTFWGLLQFIQWRYATNVKDKIHFSHVLLTKNINKDGYTNVIILGFSLNNTADFPIFYRVEDVKSSLGDDFPRRKPFVNTEYVVPPRGNGWFYDNEIDLGQIFKSQAMQGSLEFAISFGRTKDTPYKYNRKLRVFVGFNENGEVVELTWNDLTNSSKSNRVGSDGG